MLPVAVLAVAVDQIIWLELMVVTLTIGLVKMVQEWLYRLQSEVMVVVVTAQPAKMAVAVAVAVEAIAVVAVDPWVRIILLLLHLLQNLILPHHQILLHPLLLPLQVVVFHVLFQMLI